MSAVALGGPRIGAVAPGRGGLVALVAAVLVAAVLPAVTAAGTADPAATSAAVPVTPPPAEVPAVPVRFEPAGLPGEFVVRGAGGPVRISAGLTQVAVADAGSDGDWRTVAWRPVGGDPHATAVTGQRLDGVSNYLLGDDPAGWRTGVPGYASITYRDVWPGIDLVWRTARDGGGIEYDLEVAPGADPAAAVFTVDGADRLAVDDGGALVVETVGGGRLVQRPPVAWQTTADGGRDPVDVSFTVDGDRVGFTLGGYDRTRQLTIDPVLVFATFLGGSTNEAGGDLDEADAVAVGDDGAVYVAGETAAADFPTRNAWQDEHAGQIDAFVAKFDADGTLVWSTYLGGTYDPSGSLLGNVTVDHTSGAGTDRATAAAVGADGRLWVAGKTSSDDFPTTAGAYDRGCGTDGTCDREDPELTEPNDPFTVFSDAFAVRLTAAGTLDYGTYLGGSNNDHAAGVAVDGAGRAAVIGSTRSSDGSFPTTAGALQPGYQGGFADGFVAVLDATKTGDESLVYSTHLGGADGDSADAVAAEAGTSPRVLVGGHTGSSSLAGAAGGPGNGQPDGFVAALDVAGPATDLAWLTYLGGASSDVAKGVSLARGCTAACDVWVGGSTKSVDDPDTPGADEGFPTTADAHQASHQGGNEDGFVARLSPSGAVGYASHLGGSGTDRVDAVAATADGGLWLAVSGDSVDFPVVDPVFGQGAAGGFAVRLGPDGALEVSVPGMPSAAVAAGPDGGVVAAGEGREGSWTTDGAFQTEAAGGADAHIVRLAPLAAGQPLVTGVDPPVGPPPGGSRVAIAGRNLTADATVRFGGRQAQVVEAAADGRRMVVVAPRHPEGPATVTVTSADGLTSPGNPVARYTYRPGWWQPVDPLPSPRVRATATLLDDGRVLAVGGTATRQHNPTVSGFALRTVEAYQPLSRGWDTTVADLPETRPRADHTATLLADGRLLVAGGGGDTIGATAEIYDPAADVWTPAAGPSDPRYLHSATRLDGPGCEPRCGHVLVVAGPYNSAKFDAEVYDPDAGATGVWTPTGEMLDRTRNHTSTRLDGPGCAGDGRPDWCGDVLVTGGNCAMYPCTGGIDPVRTVQAYDPASNLWRKLEDMGALRVSHSAQALPDGRVLVAGGTPEGFENSEVYDPPADLAGDGEWGDVDTFTGHRRHPALVALPDGRLLLAGGSASRAAFLYEHDGWRPTAPTLTVHTAEEVEPQHVVGVVLSSDPDAFAADPTVCGFDCGRVLLVGGYGPDGFNPSPLVELYTPPPTVTGIEKVGGGPLEGPAAGGTTLRLTGFGMTHHTRQVRFADAAVPCGLPTQASVGAVPTWPQGGPCRVVDYHTLEVDVPPAAAGSPVSVPVEVVNEGGGATAPQPFTYTGPPGAAGDLTATVTSPSQVELAWSAVGQVAHTDPPARRYVVKQSTRPITAGNFEDATTLCGGSVCAYAPGATGDRLTLEVSGLRSDTTYHWAVRALADDGTAGPVSNVASATTGGTGSGAGGGDAPDVAPGPVADLSATGVSSAEIELAWSAAGSDGDGGAPAGEYVVKQSFEPIDSEADFDAAFTLCGAVCRFGPSQVGEQITLTVTGLNAETRYFYAVRAVDSAGNVGPRSNTASASTLATDGVRRVFGTGRIQTAVELSREAFPGGADHAVVARADDFPDALAASTLAAEVDGPVLLSESGRLSDDTAAELRRLGTDTVYLAGGTQALSGQVAADLDAMGIHVVRLAGTDRIGTAAAVAREVVRLGGRTDTAIVARADLFADALAAGPLAAYSRAPVLLTHTDELPSQTLQLLGEVLDGEQVTIAGGTAAVGQQPERQLQDAGYATQRLAGADRYATAVALADAAVAAGASRATVFTASGTNFPDALAAAPAAWKAGGVLVLVDPTDLDHSGATRDWLTDHAGRIDQVLIAGGPAAVSNRAEDQLAGFIAG